MLPNHIKHSDWSNSINHTKEYLVETEQDLQSYHPYLINKQMARKLENLFVVNQINQYPALDKKMQYDFFFHWIEKANPDAAKKHWTKSKSKMKDNFTSSQFEAVKAYFKYSNGKAKSAMAVLTSNQIHQIVYFMNKSKGGKQY